MHIRLSPIYFVSTLIQLTPPASQLTQLNVQCPMSTSSIRPVMHRLKIVSYFACASEWSKQKAKSRKEIAREDLRLLCVCVYSLIQSYVYVLVPAEKATSANKNQQERAPDYKIPVTQLQHKYININYACKIAILKFLVPIFRI